jgi:8-hydroxy-5-deazaflavin:NADPH oxidoreductase
MKISIVGSGEVGTFYAEHWSKAGHELVLTYYRDNIKIKALATRLGKNVSVAPPQKAVMQAEVVLFCPRFEHMEDATKQIGDIGSVILIDPNNPFNPDRSGPVNINSNQTAASIVANLFPRARHVKAFHNLGVQTIIKNSQRELVTFIASDDIDAAKIVMILATQAHLTPMLSGAFATAALSKFPGPLFGLCFATQQARKSLEIAINNI